MDDFRQAAIDAIRAFYDEYTVYDNGKSIEDLISELPSAEPQQWHVLTRRPMDEDKRKEWSEWLGYDIEYDDAYIYSNLPDDEKEVIICTHNGHVCTDIYYNNDGSYFDNHELDEVVAWMPLPEPWKGGDSPCTT